MYMLKTIQWRKKEVKENKSVDRQHVDGLEDSA